MKQFFNILFACILAIFHGTCVAALQWYPGWQLTSVMNKQRAGAAVLEADGRIYAIGGVDGVHFLASAEYSTIQADGTLSPWRMTASLNEERGFFSAVTYNHYIYAAGGGNGPNGDHYLRSIERAKVLDDGSLGPWITEKSQLNYPRRCVKLVVIGNIIYALGGFGGTLLDSVERADIAPDGSLGKWTLEKNRMTMPRYISSVKIHGHAVYVIGGHDQSEGGGLVDVEYASFGDKNALGLWQKTVAMQHPRYALSSASHDNFIYALGGLHGAIYSDVIEKAGVDERGAIENWQTTTTLSSLRANFGTVVYNNRIYIIGGTNRDGYYKTVEMANFNDQGDIGFMATSQEIATIRNAVHASTENADLFPNYGIVRQIIHTELYSYIEVTQDDATRWLAAPRSDFAVNDQVRFSRGLTMTNFHSRVLNRDFPSILFVERIEKITDEQP